MGHVADCIRAGAVHLRSLPKARALLGRFAQRALSRLVAEHSAKRRQASRSTSLEGDIAPSRVAGPAGVTQVLAFVDRTAKVLGEFPAIVAALRIVGLTEEEIAQATGIDRSKVHRTILKLRLLGRRGRTGKSIPR